MILLEIDPGLLLFLGYCVIVIVIFLLMREITLWYFRVNEQIRNQQEIIRLLRRISGEDKLQGILPGTPEYEALSKEDKEAVYA